MRYNNRVQYGMTPSFSYGDIYALSINPARASVFSYRSTEGQPRIAKFTPDIKEASQTTYNARLAEACGLRTPEHHYTRLSREKLPEAVRAIYPQQDKVAVIDMNALSNGVSLPEYLQSATVEQREKIGCRIFHETIPLAVGGLGFLDLNATNIFVCATENGSVEPYVIDINCALVGIDDQNRSDALKDPQALMAMYYEGRDIEPTIQKRIHDLLGMFASTSITISKREIQKNISAHQETLAQNTAALTEKGLGPYAPIIQERLERTKAFFTDLSS